MKHYGDPFKKIKCNILLDNPKWLFRKDFFISCCNFHVWGLNDTSCCNLYSLDHGITYNEIIFIFDDSLVILYKLGGIHV